MHIRLSLITSGVFLAFGLVAIPTHGLLKIKSRDEGVQQDRVVAGGPTDFMEVRHLVLQGQQRRDRPGPGDHRQGALQFKPAAGSDRLRTRVQQRYFEKNYPILIERMRGVAAAFGQRLEDDGWDFSGMWYFSGLTARLLGRVLSARRDRRRPGVVSRNYDFSTGTLLGTHPPPGELPSHRPALPHRDAPRPRLRLAGRLLL